MALPSLFKITANKKFEFKTRYYNADREELLERVERAKREVGAGKATDADGNYVSNIKGQMKRYIDKPMRPTRARAERNSNVRVFVILIILSLIAYYLFF